MSKPIKIAYINHESNAVFGSSSSLYHMINSLSRDITPLVITPAHGRTSIFFQERNIQCIEIPFPLDITDKRGIPRALSAFPRFVRDTISRNRGIKEASEIIKARKIDIIHTNSSITSFGHCIAQNTSTPHVWHLREFINLDFGLQPIPSWKSLIQKINAASATISITKAVQRHFEQENKPHAYQIWNAIRPAKASQLIPEKDPYFLLCGNLTPAKGADTAIKAFSLFARTHTQYRLKLIGHITIEYTKVLRQIAREHKIDHLIEILPYTDDIDAQYAKATGYLMCSKNEAMGRVTVEAMFNGCPVIGYNNAGTSEIISDNINGLLFETPEQCAHSMESILDHELALKLARAGVQTAISNFSEEAIREGILSVYDKVLAQR